MKRLTKSQYEAIAQRLRIAYDNANTPGERDGVVTATYSLAREFRISDKEFKMYDFVSQALGTIKELDDLIAKRD